MTNQLAIIIGLMILGTVAADLLYFGWDLHIFLFKKIGELTAWMAFWR
jgi:hypothetical protein